MQKPPIPANEAERLRELHSFDLLDTEAEQEFDALVGVARYITQCPISLVSLVDKDRQWFKAVEGLPVKETPRDVSFCAHAINHEQLFLVPDTHKDERFRDNPLVQEDPNIRFYAGQPLVTSNGFRIGTLCVIDNQPRRLSDEQLQHLRTLADQVIKTLECRQVRLKSEQQDFKKNAWENQVNRIIQSVKQAPIPVAILEGEDHRFLFLSDQFGHKYSLDQKSIGRSVAEIFPEKDHPKLATKLNQAFQGTTSVSAKIGGTDFRLEPIRTEAGRIFGVAAYGVQ